MGTFRLGCKIQHIADPLRSARVEKLLETIGVEVVFSGMVNAFSLSFRLEQSCLRS